MTAASAETSAALPCHECGYDLRAHPAEGQCPECGASVAASRRLIAIPARPAWRDRDPRWRRRVVAGTWVLVLLPLVHALKLSAWASRVRVPTVFDLRGSMTLDETMVLHPDVYQPLLFCIGAGLLFSNERGRRRNRLGWTRRWGVVCGYVVLLLGAAQFLLFPALVLTGIAALFMSIPLRYQPGATPFLVAVGTGYLRYGPYPKDVSVAVLSSFSSLAVLLACVPLFDALCSCASKRLAAVALAPLAVLALAHLGQVGWYYLDRSGFTSTDVAFPEFYFQPDVLARYVMASPTNPFLPATPFSAFVVEAIKWCIVLGIAVSLSVAQVARRGRGLATDPRGEFRGPWRDSAEARVKASG